VRELLEVPMPASDGRVDIYSGVARAHGKLWATVVRPEGGRPGADRSGAGRREFAVVLVHPTSNFMGHYAQEPLARRGIAAVGMTTRYLGNDSALIMENCVLDVGAVVSHAAGRHALLLGAARAPRARVRRDRGLAGRRAAGLGLGRGTTGRRRKCRTGQSPGAGDSGDSGPIRVLNSPGAVLVVVAGAAGAGVSAVVETFGPRGGAPPVVRVPGG